MAKRNETAIAALFDEVEEMQDPATSSSKQPDTEKDNTKKEKPGVQPDKKKKTAAKKQPAPKAPAAPLVQEAPAPEQPADIPQEKENGSPAHQPEAQTPPADKGDALHDAITGIEQKMRKENAGDRTDRVTFLLRKDLNERLDALCKIKPHGFKSQVFNTVVELILSQYEK